MVKSCWIARKQQFQEEKDDIWAARIVKDCWLLKYPLRVWIMPKEFFIPTIWCRKLNRKPVIFSIKMLDGLCHSVYHILAHFEYTSHSIVPSPLWPKYWNSCFPILNMSLKSLLSTIVMHPLSQPLATINSIDLHRPWTTNSDIFPVLIQKQVNITS